MTVYQGKFVCLYIVGVPSVMAETSEPAAR